MDKYIITPLKTPEHEGGRTLMERNSPMDRKDDEVEIIIEKLPEKKTQLAEVADKSLTEKKIKVRKSRGEKRKLPDKPDLARKIKKKKNEDKDLENSQIVDGSNCNGGGEECDILETSLVHPAQEFKKLAKARDSPAAENDSDVENGERAVKPKSSRKKKAIASTCQETLEVLLKFDSDVLDLLDKSFKIVKSHNLLSNKYISLDILIDLVTLALEKNRGSEVLDSDKELLSIITKCTNELCSTPKRSKARQSITTVPDSPNNKSTVQEEPPAIPPAASTEEVLDKSQDSEEPLEKSEADIIVETSEKSQEPTVEKSGKNFCITNYFKKLKKTVEERDKNERFSCFTTKTDMFLAPKLGGELTGERREKFEDLFTAQDSASRYLSELFRKPKRSNKSVSKVVQEMKSVSEVVSSVVSSAVESENCFVKEEKTCETKPDQAARKRITPIRVDEPKVEPKIEPKIEPKVEAIEAVCRTKAKLFQFHDNRRPPYWGTWRRKSESVGPRKPFAKDKMFNYEIDSDDEWEEEEEPGESLHGSDDEKEPEEDYEVDNDFFVPHGYLSDDENPEKENLSSKTKLDLLEEQFTSEQKQKMRKMTPIVFGTFWVHKGIPSEGTLYQDLQVERLQYVPWTSVPIEIEEEEATSTVKKPKQKIFPDEEIPNLIKMIHGSPQNCAHLARKFLLYWETEKIPDGNRPPLTKVCVQKKIKELAAWQASHEKGKMCWHVPKETREEFGAEVEKKTPEKKPRKCFIWKFVRRAEKSPGVTNPPPAPPIEPEVVILES